MKNGLLALAALTILIASCVPTPALPPPVVFQTATRSLATATSVPSQTPTALPARTNTPPRTLTATSKSGPQPTKVWTGATFLIETSNLSINYPDIIPQSEAKKHADILQRAYDTYLVLFGGEQPFGGKKITIKWDPQSTGGANAGNPTVFCGRCALLFAETPGQFNPPHSGFFHELTHDFTNASRSRAARYLSINSAMSEAFATYFAYYFEHEVLRYSEADIAAAEKLRAIELQALADYEARKTDPYSMGWGARESPQFFFMGMMFRVADQCGWGTWQKFFSLALNSGNPGLSPDHMDRFGDMKDPTAKKAFADFVGFLSQACGKDLRPMFRNWRFDVL